jgi:hypothetical protein
MFIEWLNTVFTSELISSAHDVLLPSVVILILFGFGARAMYKKHINRLNGLDKKV